MAATKHTTNYNLPVFVNDDIPTWLGDWNTTMNDIDTALKNISDNAGSDVNKAYVDGEIERVEGLISTLQSTVTEATSKLNSIETLVTTLSQTAVRWGASNTGITAKQYEQLKILASE